MTAQLITPQELLQAPTGIDWASLSESAVAGSQVIEQTNICDIASAWVANELEQPLGIHATTQTEQYMLHRTAHQGSRAFVTREGSLVIRTSTLPIISVTSIQIGFLPGPLAFQTLDPSMYYINGQYPQVYRVEDWSRDWTAYQYGTSSWGYYTGTSQAVVQITYVSGWPNAILQASVSAPSAPATLQVDTTVGFATSAMATGMDNSTVTIWDGAKEETVTITAIPDSTHLTVASLTNPHNAGVRISNMPRDLRQAVIFSAMQVARERGTDALVIGQAGGGARIPAGDTGDAEFQALRLLTPYRRRV